MKTKATNILFVLLSAAPLSLAQTAEADKAGKMQKPGKDPCFVHKQSDIIGADVRNLQGENLGEIEDLVIDPATGQVEYAALSFGGFLGMGDKLFALPWPVLDATHDGDKKYFLLSVDKEQLKQSPGFPKDNWPDISAPEWSDSIRKFYAEELRNRPARPEFAGSAKGAIDASQRFHLVKASDLKGSDVDTQDGSDAGEISELVIDPTRGRIPYVILSEGGFLGFGTDKYAVPWEACSFTVDEDKDIVCKLKVPKAVFEKAPAYKDDDWKTMSDPVFVERVYGHYGYPVYWKKSVVDAGSKN